MAGKVINEVATQNVLVSNLLLQSVFQHQPNDGALHFRRDPVYQVVDQTGRLLEEVVVPIELTLRLMNPGTTRRAVKALAQRILDLHQRAIVAVAREQISKRLAHISVQYGRGVQRSIRREERLAAILATEARPLVQAGLFDRRALKARAFDRDRDSLAWNESGARRHMLRSAVAGITAQEPQIALILLVSTSA